MPRIRCGLQQTATSEVPSGNGSEERRLLPASLLQLIGCPHPPGGQMRRCVLRCVLVSLLVVWSAVPAAAGTIVGEFFFVRDVCDPADEFCQPFEYFNLTNIVDPLGPLAGLTFSAVIQIQELLPDSTVHVFDYEEQLFPLPIAFGEFAMTSGLPATPPFAGGGKASLVFADGNVADYFGTLSLSNLLYDDGSSSPTFSAQVVFTENGPVAVTEAPSWLVVVIGLGALAAGRAFFV